MSKQTVLDIKHIAKLANLTLTPDEEKKLEKQLLETITYVERLNEVDTRNINPTNQVTSLENIEREDKPTPSLSQEQALKNAKDTYNGFFKVDAILEE